MISILKSIWSVAGPGYQMVIIVGVNLLYMSTFFIFSFMDIIPLVIVQVANLLFWLVIGTIILFGNFWFNKK